MLRWKAPTRITEFSFWPCKGPESIVQIHLEFSQTWCLYCFLWGACYRVTGPNISLIFFLITVDIYAPKFQSLWKNTTFLSNFHIWLCWLAVITHDSQSVLLSVSDATISSKTKSVSFHHRNASTCPIWISPVRRIQRSLWKDFDLKSMDA